MGYVRNQTRQIPITAKENLIVTNKGFNYYAVDFRQVDPQQVYDIIAGLEAVEKDTWIAQEDFWQYIRKCDFVVYAEKNGQIIGFNLVSIMHKNEFCIYTIDEAMVLRAFQGNNIARNVVIIGLWWFMKMNWLDERIRRFVLVSTSCNPKVVNNYFKNKYVTKILDNSFKPSQELIAVHNEYVKKYNYELVDKDYPFCLKNMFPGSNQFEKYDKIPQYLNEVRSKMPPEFDYIQRGDAWAFMVNASKMTYYMFAVATSLTFIGSKALFNKKIGLLKRKKPDAIWEPTQMPERLTSYFSARDVLN
ncbi:MAG: hypothetical protein PHU36_01945 [Syntrophomonadaceae bacterium]|nr:hypothetical protein [Syntrophomonadaceae bacterium]